ncbi:MAG: FHA domain-containing protein [Archangiaceae bacterium]|nr:FHA domain-containing protein [Archangiaceae bacterium]
MKLIIEDDEGRKTVVPFVRDEITIGRQEGNTIRLTERNVSRRHARLLRQNGHILVEDLGSYNGIRINGDRIQGQVQVNEGDLIQIGDYDLAVQREGEAAAAPASNGHDHAHANGTNPNAVTRPIPDPGATVPILPTVEPAAARSGEEPEEANPEDVTLQPVPAEEAAGARRQSTAIIRMDQVEQNRARQILDIDAAEAPRLIVLNTELAGREYSCVRTELKLGRTDENDIAIDHRSLSRTHCKIVREDTGEWRVIDMQSANGLMVNGESYAQSALRSGDVIELGHVKMKFVGAGERYDAAEAVADASGSGSRMGVFIAVAVVALCVVAGAGFLYLRQKPSRVTPTPIEAAQVPPKAGKAEPQPPLELTPEQQRAAVEAKLKEARQKIDALDIVAAQELLKGCFVGESLHPEAQKLLVDLKTEEPLLQAINKADQLLDEGNVAGAKDQLGSAEHTVFFLKRWGEVHEKMARATERTLQQGQQKPPEGGKPPPQQAVRANPPPPPPPANSRAEVERLYEDAQKAYNLKTRAGWEQAKALLERCIKIDKTYAECHKKLGATLGQLNDGPNGAKEYEKFLQLAPDHPQAEKVRQLLEQYYKGAK